MPASNGKYDYNEKLIHDYLIDAGYNEAAVCGILANIEAESGFNPRNLQDGYEGEYNDDSYTGAVDKYQYTVYKAGKTFTNDKYGYGICQWSSSDRKEKLLDIATSLGESVGELKVQLMLLHEELLFNYDSVGKYLKSLPNTASGAYDAGRYFCTNFESPDDPRGRKAESRGVAARDIYFKHYMSTAKDEDPKVVPNIGKKIVEIAREQIGDSYSPGGEGPDLFDSAGLVYYSYITAGVGINKDDVLGYYERYKESASKITNISSLAPGDLLLYIDTAYKYDSTISYIAIATGEGSRVFVSEFSEVVIEDKNIGNPTVILRLLSSAETSKSEITEDNDDTGVDEGWSHISPTEYVSLTSYDGDSIIFNNQLSRFEAEGYDYGYLIDITNGEEFKFYVPEFEESAGVEWSPIDIMSRSVTVHAYNKTNSRVVNVSLELYAGEGLYKLDNLEDAMIKLHSDANFLKSLEYPDYRRAIARPPATVMLILGSAFKMIGVASNVRVEHLKPLDSQNRSMYLKVSFTVTQVASNPPDFKDIRAGQYVLPSNSNRDTKAVTNSGGYTSVRENNIVVQKR